MDQSELVAFLNNARGQQSAPFTTSANPVTNKPLRMRVISDANTNNLNSSCYNPVYGQAEDYTVIFDNPQGVEASLTEANPMAYPNPNTGNFSITNPFPSSVDYRVDIFNMLGHNVYTEIIPNGIRPNNQYNLSHLPPGLYNLRVSSGPRGSKQCKLVIVR